MRVNIKKEQIIIKPISPEPEKITTGCYYKGIIQKTKYEV